jgi:hypothetical protein
MHLILARQFNIVFASLLLACLFQGCAFLPYIPGQQAIANLRVVGSKVQVNNYPAIDGKTVMLSDDITAGDNSSALIEYVPCDGGVQLDEHTDPRFAHVWKDFNLNIVIDSVKTGQISVEMNKACHLTMKLERPIKTVLDSDDVKYNIKAEQNQTIITVQEGTVKLSQPSHLSITEGQQVIITKDGVKSIRKLSAQELREVTKWRDRFPIPGALVRSGSRSVCECVD